MTRSAWARLVLLAGVWGCSFLFIKVALEGLAPTQVVLGRMVAGASLFVLGFTAVFVSSGALFGYFGDTLQDNKGVLSKVLGVSVGAARVRNWKTSRILGLSPNMLRSKFNSVVSR